MSAQPLTINNMMPGVTIADASPPTSTESERALTWRPQPALLDQAMDIAIAIGLAVLILVGFATSYRTLRDLAVTEGDYPLWLAPAVPLSFDLGIVVLSLKVIRSAREGRSAPFLRVIVAVLSTATVIANASAADTTAARVLHAVPPAMFVICFESVVITARRHALASMGLLPTPLPRVRAAQWALDPRLTARAWRRLVLQSDAPALTAVRPVQPVSGDPVIDALPSRDRLDVARDALARDPEMSAPALAVVLEAAGHRVSVRTAQRMRAALQPVTSQSA